MTITSEMLAAYAEGKVSGAERDAIRKYLAENPSELKSVVMMMDEDYDLDLDEGVNKSFDYSCGAEDGSDFNIALSAAAFAPLGKGICKPQINNSRKQRKSFDSCINDLLDEIF